MVVFYTKIVLREATSLVYQKVSVVKNQDGIAIKNIVIQIWGWGLEFISKVLSIPQTKITWALLRI